MNEEDPDRPAGEPVEPDWAYLNERFYTASSAKYFDQRMNGLLVVAADDETYGLQLRSGLDVLSLHAHVGDEEKVSTDLDQRELRRYITAETEVLLHHTTESMLRLYLAHEADRECPWFEVVSLPFDAFWALLKERFESLASDALKRRVAWTVTGFAERPPGLDCDQQTWDRGVDCIAAWLRFLYRQMLERSSVYNAAKHGFTGLAEEAYFGFGETPDNMAVSHSGPSIESLERSPWVNGERIWSLRTDWYSTIGSWAYITIATQLMNAIWSTGRSRYLGEPIETLFLPQDMPIDVQMATSNGPITQFKRQFLVERRVSRLPVSEPPDEPGAPTRDARRGR